MIPKVIHYCWFGHGEKPDIIKKCIENWKTMLPDFEIIEWNEDNIDVNMYDFSREAYELKKYGFVVDPLRLWIVYNYGGIYMDTDVEILKRFDYLLDYKAFFAFQTEINVALGLGFGAEKNNPLIKAVLDEYNDKKFIINGKENKIPSPAVDTGAIIKALPDFNTYGKTQIVDGAYFMSPGEYASIMYHYGTATWNDEKDTSGKKRKYKNSWLKRRLRSEKRLKRISKHYGTRRYRIQIFIAYDLLDRGLWFYTKRLFKKIFCRKKAKNNEK